MLQWVFSLAGLSQLIGVLLLAGAAVWFSRTRSIVKFACFSLLVWVAASLFGATTPFRLRAFVAWAIWAFCLVAVYTVSLGTFVAKGKGPRPILILAAVLFALLTPLSWLPAIYFSCYVGYDCP
jgi:hypothetical protein